MKLQTSGCIRQVVARKSPRSGGKVAEPPSTWPRALTSGPGRVGALGGLGQLLGIAEHDQVLSRAGDASTLASDIWPASPMKRWLTGAGRGPAGRRLPGD